MRASALAMFVFLSSIAIPMPALAEVVINEINPWGDIEWVELYNTADENISIGGWFIETPTSLKDATLPQNATISAKGFFVAGDNSTGNDYNEIEISR